MGSRAKDMVASTRSWMISSVFLTMISILSTSNSIVSGFTTPSTIHRQPLFNSYPSARQRRRPFEHRHQQNHALLSPPKPSNNNNPFQSPSSLAMGFNLPPGKNGPFAAIEEILPFILTFGAVLLFFASPLGSLFF